MFARAGWRDEATRFLWPWNCSACMALALERRRPAPPNAQTHMWDVEFPAPPSLNRQAALVAMHVVGAAARARERRGPAPTHPQQYVSRCRHWLLKLGRRMWRCVARVREQTVPPRPLPLFPAHPPGGRGVPLARSHAQSVLAGGGGHSIGVVGASSQMGRCVY